MASAKMWMLYVCDTVMKPRPIMRPPTTTTKRTPTLYEMATGSGATCGKKVKRHQVKKPLCVRLTPLRFLGTAFSIDGNERI